MDQPPTQSASTRRTNSISIPSPSSSRGSGSVDSTTSLLLVRDEDTDDDVHSPLLFVQSDSESDYDQQDEDDYYIPLTQRPLAPSRVILLLTAPTLRLGALLLPSVASTSLIVSIPCLVLAGVLALFVRHLWVLLAHYVRKVTVEDVLCEALGRLRSGRRRKALARFLVRSAGTFTRVLLVTLYLNVAISSISSVLPSGPATKPVLSCALLIVLILFGPSTASISGSRTLFITFLSCIAYLTWLGLLIHAQVVGDELRNGSLSSNLGVSPLWDSLTVSLALFATFPPLPIYASLSTYRFPAQALGHGQKKRRRESFGTLSVIAFALSLLFTIPVLFVSAVMTEWASSDFELASAAIQLARGLTLLFAIPETMATLPKLPWPSSQSRMRLRRLLASQIVPRSLLLVASTLASFLPSSITSVLLSIILVLTLLATYILPTVLHILFHNIFRPTSIVLPRTRSYHVTSPQEAEEEESAARLLNAKEKKLQRRRFWRRISWDVLSWFVIFGSILWIVGRVAHWWWWM